MGRALRMDVAEIYSPPRVAEMAARLELQAGWSLDLTTTDEEGIPWDFNKEDRRKAAMDKVKKDEPLPVIGSPMCTNWSTIMNLNWDKMDPGEKERGSRVGWSNPNLSAHVPVWHEANTGEWR